MWGVNLVISVIVSRYRATVDVATKSQCAEWRLFGVGVWSWCSELVFYLKKIIPKLYTEPKKTLGPSYSFSHDNFTPFIHNS